MDRQDDDLREEMTTPGAFVTVAVVFEGGLLLVAWFVGWLLDKPPLELVRFTWLAVLVGVAGTVPLLVGMWWSVRSRWRPMRRLKAVVERRLVPLFDGCSYTDLALIALVAGIGEEALFRGVIQKPIADAIGPMAGPAVGVAVASVLFAGVHLITPAYGVMAGIISVYLGVLMIYFDNNLLPPMIIHALYDFIALCILARQRDRKLRHIAQRQASSQAEDDSVQETSESEQVH